MITNRFFVELCKYKKLLKLNESEMYPNLFKLIDGVYKLLLKSRSIEAKAVQYLLIPLILYLQLIRVSMKLIQVL